MTKSCASCGRVFEAARDAAKYCGDTCRKRAQRRPKGLAAVPTPPPASPDPPVDGGLAAATRVSLEGAGRLESELGAAAMLLARRLDVLGERETGAGVAALMKEYRATLADALRDAEEDEDELDVIRGSAALKLLPGGRRDSA